MAEIKSALELALEKTEGMKVDKEKLYAKENKIKGRKAALAFLDGKVGAKELSKTIKAYKAKDKDAFLSGAGEIFISYIRLPQDDSYRGNFKKAAEGFGILSGSPKEINKMFEQLEQFMDQYLVNREQLENQLASQFEPLLRQKEEAIAAQTGQRIRLNPMDDPQYQQAYSQNIEQLESRYLEALNGAKDQLKELISLEEPSL